MMPVVYSGSSLPRYVRIKVTNMEDLNVMHHVRHHQTHQIKIR